MFKNGKNIHFSASKNASLNSHFKRVWIDLEITRRAPGDRKIFSKILNKLKKRFGREKWDKTSKIRKTPFWGARG